MTEFPFPPDELARRLSQNLAARPNGLVLTVSSPALARTPDGPALTLRLNAQPADETWDLAIPLDPVDLTLAPQALVAVLRANIEEWWDCKDAEPHLAAWGHRLN